MGEGWVKEKTCTVMEHPPKTCAASLSLPPPARRGIRRYEVCTAILAVSLLGCADVDNPVAAPGGADAHSPKKGETDYQTVDECRAQLHPGRDPWTSFCEDHGGWHDGNTQISAVSCRKVDCERNAEHVTGPLASFFLNGCRCAAGTPPAARALLEDPEAPKFCSDAQAGRVTFCGEFGGSFCGTGTRFKGVSCSAIDRDFTALACATAHGLGGFSEEDWVDARLTCCWETGNEVDRAAVCGGTPPPFEEPDVPEPDVPEPDQPDVPEPDVPDPDVDVPEPDVPDPDVDAPPVGSCNTDACDPQGQLQCGPLDVLDVDFYRGHYPDLQAAFGSNVRALQNHYLRHGIDEGRQPNAAFSPDTYLAVNTDVAREIGGTNYRGALEHWMTTGMQQCRDLSFDGDGPGRDACRGAVCDPGGQLRCRQLDVLDTDYYRTRYPDLQAAFGANVTALQNHYLAHGIDEGREPNPFFSPASYLAANPDVARAFGSRNHRGALDHWVDHGMRECRTLR